MAVCPADLAVRPADPAGSPLKWGAVEIWGSEGVFLGSRMVRQAHHPEPVEGLESFIVFARSIVFPASQAGREPNQKKKGIGSMKKFVGEGFKPSRFGSTSGRPLQFKITITGTSHCPGANRVCGADGRNFGCGFHPPGNHGRVAPTKNICALDRRPKTVPCLPGMKFFN